MRFYCTLNDNNKMSENCDKDWSDSILVTTARLKYVETRQSGIKTQTNLVWLWSELNQRSYHPRQRTNFELTELIKQREFELKYSVAFSRRAIKQVLLPDH